MLVLKDGGQDIFKGNDAGVAVLAMIEHTRYFQDNLEGLAVIWIIMSMKDSTLDIFR